MTLILASQSPRRRELLADAGYDFEVVVPVITERESPWLSLRELTVANATRKALAIAQERPGAVVLGADTLVALDGKLIGKPRDLKHAREILRRLSGCVHEVCTGVFVASPSGCFASFAEVSLVRFRRLTEKSITTYFRNVNPLDKAGAYAAQIQGREIITEVEGSLSNVIGLPMEQTAIALTQFGIIPRG